MLLSVWECVGVWVSVYACVPVYVCVITLSATATDTKKRPSFTTTTAFSLHQRVVDSQSEIIYHFRDLERKRKPTRVPENKHARTDDTKRRHRTFFTKSPLHKIRTAPKNKQQQVLYLFRYFRRPYLHHFRPLFSPFTAESLLCFSTNAPATSRARIPKK